MQFATFRQPHIGDQWPARESGNIRPNGLIAIGGRSAIQQQLLLVAPEQVPESVRWSVGEKAPGSVLLPAESLVWFMIG